MDAILLLAAIFVWIVLMALTRRHPWALAWWLPGMVGCAGATFYLWLIVDDGSSRGSTPGGGGGEVIYAMLVWGMRLALALLCVICAVLRPRRA